MTLLEPVWLILLFPLGAALLAWPMPSRLLMTIRATVIALLLGGMAGLAVKLPSRAGTVVIVADRSRSMPGDALTRHDEAVKLIASQMRGENRLAVISFAQVASVDHAPQIGAFGGFTSEVGADASNLHDAIEMSLSLISPDSPGRIIVLSDGAWTGRDPMAMAAAAAARGIAIDYRYMPRPGAGDLAIAAIDAPPTVNPAETFLVTAWISSPISQPIEYEVRRGNTVLAAGSRSAPTGLSRLTFRDTAPPPSTLAYTIRVRAASDDPVPENNTARLLVGVSGPRPILLLTENASSGLPRLLRAGGLEIDSRTPDQTAWSLADLSSYAAVIIEDTPANKIGDIGMQNLAEWVKHTGSGLMLTGGQTSYGPGGYFKSPLDPIMPVSMEMRREHRKHMLAIVVALDRSGSMAAPVGGGRRKIDLANLAAAQVADMLSPMDEFGVLAVDSQAHLISELAPLTEPEMVKDRIRRIDSMGGGIFVFEALSHAASMLNDATPTTRHIILFSDAQDSEEPGQYKQLLEQCRAANITCSVIGLGTENDVDAPLLKDIAERGGGRIFFTENAEELPRLFAQDTFVVARSTFVDEQTPIKTTAGLVTVTGRVLPDAPPVGGYNLTYLREGANLGAVTEDEYAAPLIASHNAGAGRVLCYTAQADGKFTGPIAGWSEIGDLMTGLARWTAGKSSDLGDNVITQQVREGICYVTLHLDPNRRTPSLPQTPIVNTLRGIPGEKPRSEQTVMRWTSPDTLGVEIPLSGVETAINTVHLAGYAPISLTPVTLPYSPEFAPPDADRGEVSLKRLARISGGADRASLSGVWADLPRRPRLINLRPWLLSLAALLLLAEVLERRTGALSMMGQFQMTREKSTEVERRPAAPRKPPVAKPAPQPKKAAPAKTAPEPTEPQPTPQGGVLDALGDARRRARQRTDRKK